MDDIKYFRVYQSKCVEKGYIPFQCFRDKVNLVTFLDENENFYFSCFSCDYKLYLDNDTINYIKKIVESWEDDSEWV